MTLSGELVELVRDDVMTNREETKFTVEATMKSSMQVSCLVTSNYCSDEKESIYTI